MRLSKLKIKKCVEQVIFNLTRNAIEALSDITDREKKITETIIEGNFSIITVSDNGPGISNAMQERLFEPFASDKSNGMGLGLALCERIAERLEGKIEISNNISFGTVGFICTKVQNAT